MDVRWFSREEVEELTTPVIKRISRAVRHGRTDEAILLCDLLRDERILLHDFFAESCAALVTWIGRNLGEATLSDAFGFIFERSARRQIFELLDLGADRGLEAALLARSCWVAHSCSGAGEHGGSFSLVEDNEKFTFIMDPCGSGGRIWRKGLYGPPFDLDTTSRSYPWSYNRKGFPYYCVHCSFLNELLPNEHLGFITWPVDPPGDAADACSWYLYKDRHAVPERYYRRFGLEKKEGAGRQHGAGRRRFTDEELQEMVRPTPDRIRDSLLAGDRRAAVRLCRRLGGEFFFLHNLCVNALVSALDFIARHAGEEGLGEALSFVYEKCVREQLVSVVERFTPREALAFIVRNLFLADTCGGAGFPPARLEITEDRSKVEVTLDPCGSGGKLLRRRAYEPGGRVGNAREAVENQLLGAAVKVPLPHSLMERAVPVIADYLAEPRKPEGAGMTERGYRWSGGRPGLPYYCAFCTAFLEESGCGWLEVIPPADRKGPCTWRARK